MLFIVNDKKRTVIVENCVTSDKGDNISTKKTQTGFLYVLI